MKYCSNCGAEIKEGANVCLKCGKFVNMGKEVRTGTNLKSKIVAGLLGLLFGAWGVHNFYLGYTSKAITQIIVTIVTCGIGGIWGFVEGILILAGNITTDADGNPLEN